VYDSGKVDYRLVKIAAPIAKVHVPLYKHLEKELDGLFVDGEVICIKYTHSERIDWNDEIGLSGSVKNWTIPFGGSVIGKTEFKIHLTSSEEEDSYVSVANLTTGEIIFTLPETGSPSGNIQITIPELTKGGIAFTQTIPLPSSGIPYIYPLEGYIIETDVNHDIRVHFLVDASGSGDLNVEFELTKMEVSYMSGYFGQLKYNDNEGKMDFDFFDKLNLVGSFGFKGIQMDAVVTNRTGIPMNIKADFFFTNENGLNKPLDMEKPFDITVLAATESGSNHIVEPSVTTPPFSTSLSQIEFNDGQYPSQLKFNVNGISNPDIEIDKENFVVKNNDDPLAEIDFTLTMPMYIKIEGYSRKDTIDFDYNHIVGNDEDHINNVEYLNINLMVDNNLPFDVTMKEAIVINEQETYRERIMSENKISSGEKGKYIEIQLNKEKLEGFRKNDVKKIILSTSGKTSNGVDNYVQVKESASLDIAVSVNAKLNIPSNF